MTGAPGLDRYWIVLGAEFPERGTACAQRASSLWTEAEWSSASRARPVRARHCDRARAAVPSFCRVLTVEFARGTAGNAAATKALGLVDRVRAFPTTIFLGANGLPKAIHSGFAGPARREHAALRAEFERRIEALLGD